MMYNVTVERRRWQRCKIKLRSAFSSAPFHSYQLMISFCRGRCEIRTSDGTPPSPSGLPPGFDFETSEEDAGAIIVCA